MYSALIVVLTAINLQPYKQSCLRQNSHSTVPHRNTEMTSALNNDGIDKWLTTRLGLYDTQAKYCGAEPSKST